VHKGCRSVQRSQTFHEPFVLFGYIAAITRGLVTASASFRNDNALRQAAAEVDLLTGGKFVLASA